jgi:predicted ribosome quality control (RQC) complex YloA/Tae2 family protein
MSEKIVRHIPSGSIKVKRVVDKRDKTPIEYVDKNTKQEKVCYIYKVSGSYVSGSQNTTKSYSSVSSPKVFAIKRLNELKDEKKYFRNEDEILLEKTIIEGPYRNKILIEASTNHGRTNHKYLKIWKYFWTDEYGWKPKKQGITIPIKDGKDLIKELYEILVRS